MRTKIFRLEDNDIVMKGDFIYIAKWAEGKVHPFMMYGKPVGHFPGAAIVVRKMTAPREIRRRFKLSTKRSIINHHP